MSIAIVPANLTDIPAHYGIMALCGEHMHRVLGLSHWYPFPNSDWFTKHNQGRDLYGVIVDDLLVGTFSLSENKEPYDDGTIWEEPDAHCLYFSAFGILPSYQQKGIGSEVMRRMDAMVQEQGYPRVRFDAVAHHEKLLHFYTRLGYEQKGVHPVGMWQVMFFEKIFA